MTYHGASCAFIRMPETSSAVPATIAKARKQVKLLTQPQLYETNSLHAGHYPRNLTQTLRHPNESSVVLVDVTSLEPRRGGRGNIVDVRSKSAGVHFREFRA